MLILLRTQVDRTDKTPVTARRARVGSLCGFRSPAERVPIQQQKTRRCADVRECCRNGKRKRRTSASEFRQREKPQAAKQPAMDLSRDKNAEEMKWSPLEMGAAKQAHGAGAGGYGCEASMRRSAEQVHRPYDRAEWQIPRQSFSSSHDR